MNTSTFVFTHGGALLGYIAVGVRLPDWVLNDDNKEPRRFSPSDFKRSDGVVSVQFRYFAMRHDGAAAPLISSARRLGFIDVPDARKVHLNSIPRVGGIAMVAGTVVALLLWQGQAQELWAILLALLVILSFGVWDDRSDLDFRIKFLGQVIAALLVILVGDVSIDHIPFWHSGLLPRFISIPLTLFALLSITNGVNFSDGLDGLAGGIMLLSFGAISVLAYMAGGYSPAIFGVAMIGSIFGFLRFNTHPARVFMGDGGSQALGFSAGVLCILLTQRVDPVA